MNQVAIVLSTSVFDELSDVLTRPKLERLIPRARAENVLSELARDAVWRIPIDSIRDCRDAKDDKYLELALAAGADVIVSGDADLLSPGDFLAWQVTRSPPPPGA